MPCIGIYPDHDGIFLHLRRHLVPGIAQRIQGGTAGAVSGMLQGPAVDLALETLRRRRGLGAAPAAALVALSTLPDLVQGLPVAAWSIASGEGAAHSVIG